MNYTYDRGGFGVDWTDITTDTYEGYKPKMSDFHTHKYYEISLITSGNVKILLEDSAVSSTDCKIMLLRPMTPHFVFCESDMLYRRFNICFSPDFLTEEIPEWQSLLNLFGKNGRIITLTKNNCKEYEEIIKSLIEEDNIFRKKLILLYLLSLILDRENTDVKHFVPNYITDALKYISENYMKKLVASDLAYKYSVGRTTFLTSFKKYTGLTFNDYLNRCRIKKATAMLKHGLKQSYVAEECGFSNATNMIRCFKRYYNKTPKQYINSKTHRES